MIASHMLECVCAFLRIQTFDLASGSSIMVLLNETSSGLTPTLSIINKIDSSPHSKVEQGGQP